MPPRQLSRVVFPLPEGPVNASRSPGATWRETSRKTGRASYCFETRRHSIAVGCMVRAVVGTTFAAACDGIPRAIAYAAPRLDATWKACGAADEWGFQGRRESLTAGVAARGESQAGQTANGRSAGSVSCQREYRRGWDICGGRAQGVGKYIFDAGWWEGWPAGRHAETVAEKRAY